MIEQGTADGKFKTELMMAVMIGSQEDVKTVLKSGDLFLTDNHGRTALFYAAERGDEEIAWLLLASLPGIGLACRRGGLLEIRDNDGNFAEDWAEMNGQPAMKKLLSAERMRIDFFE